MKKRYAVVILTWIIMLLICNPVIAQDNAAASGTSSGKGSNLVMNPGFEEREGDDPYFWSGSSWENKGNFQLDHTQAHSGQASVLITNSTETDTRFKQQINVKSNTCYKLSCWTKTENVGQNTKGANISIEGLVDTSSDIRGSSGDWTYLELYGISGPDQKSFTLTLGLGGYSSTNTGKAWFDDAAVEEMAAAPDHGTIVNLYTETSGSSSAAAQKTSGMNTGLIFLLAAVLLIAAFAWYIMRNPGSGGRTTSRGGTTASGGASASAGASTPAGSALQPYPARMKLDKKDLLIMTGMTLAYLLLALWNLGSLNAPETSWTPSKQGESIIVDLGREISAGPIYFYGGIGHTRPDTGKYRIQYRDSSGAFQPLATIEKNEGNIFIWQYVNCPDIRTRYMKILADVPGGTLNELVFFEKGSRVPLEGIKVLEDNTFGEDEGVVGNLLDEPDTVDYNHTFLSGMIFDEIYHARTAFEYLHRMEPYEWTHPPLGKLIMSLGILLFGMTPFGWRIAGTLFGVAMIPIMYLFGRKMFGKRFYAFCSAFLMMFDFMHFGLTRIATIDVYGTFFIILMYYFMYDYYTGDFYKTGASGFQQSLRPLFLCGICFGLGASSKWIGLYAGGGLALLFFLKKFREYRDYTKCLTSKSKKAPWLQDFLPLYVRRTVLYCILFFVIIPGAIYMLSYIPYILTPGHDSSILFTNQAAMLKYHSKDVLSATHSYASPWWQWPIMSRPLLTYYGSDLPAGMSSSMTIMGNPAIWWVGIIAILASIVTAVRKQDRKMAVVFTAIAFQYVPWFGITRIVFIYHFFSSVPFLILSIVYMIRTIMEHSRKEMKYVVYGYLGLVFLLFAMFYPVLSGLEVPRDYVVTFLQWFKNNWVF